MCVPWCWQVRASSSPSSMKVCSTSHGTIWSHGWSSQVCKTMRPNSLCYLVHTRWPSLYIRSTMTAALNRCLQSAMNENPSCCCHGSETAVEKLSTMLQYFYLSPASMTFQPQAGTIHAAILYLWLRSGWMGPKPGVCRSGSASIKCTGRLRTVHIEAQEGWTLPYEEATPRVYLYCTVCFYIEILKVVVNKLIFEPEAM